MHQLPSKLASNLDEVPASPVPDLPTSAGPPIEERSKKRVLIVDDDRSTRQALTKLLIELGETEITEAEDGMQVLKHLVSDKPKFDLVLVDLIMPRMDGVELLRHLAVRDFTTPIIVMSSAHANILRTVDQLVRLYSLDVVGVLPKPIDKSTLQGLLWELDFQSQNPNKTRKQAVPPLTYQPSIAELRHALQDFQLDVMYQPTVFVSDGSLYGAEALARWRHPEHGIIGPMMFIPLAERFGIIGDLTRFVFDKAMAQCKAWEHSGVDIMIAVNISVDSLGDTNLPNDLEAIAHLHGVQTQKITLELTESRLLEDERRAMEVLTRLRVKGFNLAIDDFGTGYSSLQQLCRVPTETLKIDQCFVHRASENESARAIQQSSAHLSRQLGLKLVAEGIETQADWDIVAQNKCDFGQGFFIAPPMWGDELVKWAKSRENLRLSRRASRETG